MSSDFVLSAKARNDLGKGASRRLRREANLVPAVVYGGKKEPQSISVALKDIQKATESEAFFTSIINLDVDGKSEQVVVKDLQRHPAKEKITHADFQRVDASTKITMHVPLHFIDADKCPGVKQQGGNAVYALNDIEVSCLPKDLPEYIEVDMGACELGSHIHISDLKLPAGVASVALTQGEDHDLQIVSIHAPRGGASDDDEADAEEEGQSDGE